MPTKNITVTVSPGTIDPGPKASAAQARRARAGALALLQSLIPLNLPFAAKHIAANRPSPEAVAMLAFQAHELMTRAEQSRRGKVLRKADLTREDVAAFKADFERKHKKSRGWKTAAALEFDTDLRTISKRI